MAVAALAVLGFLIGATVAVRSLSAGLLVALLGITGWILALRGTHPLGRDRPDLAWLLGTRPGPRPVRGDGPGAPPRGRPGAAGRR
jgi:hypothetical protein